MPVQFPAVIELSALDGSNGFMLNGITASDHSGVSVGSAGDINNDGVADLIIGAADAISLSYIGQSYVVFGGVNIGSSGTAELANLNGNNGFILNGITVGDYSGISVSSAGDINNDGVADLLIGAYKAAPNGAGSGQSYVVFGGLNVGSGGTLALSTLDGSNGFKLNGITASDFSGRSVSAAGDINNDGVADLIIGAYNAAPDGRTGAGQSYVVFGDSGVGSAGVLDFSSLNGSNGFKINGIVVNDQSGRSVSALGDINNDGIDDLIIGAYGSNVQGAYSGQSYVVFGSLDVGSSGTLELSNLNGSNGFKLNGVAAGDYSGWSVSGAGDINNDGVADLIIGAFRASPNGSESGQSYVVFGGTGIGSSGTFELSSLNGSNGFDINGVASNDFSGYCVSGAGDINADGVDDLIIGAFQAQPNGVDSGQSYVVFGGLSVGSSGSLELSGLNGSNGFTLNGIAANDQSAVSVSDAGDINNDGVDDLVIGAQYADPNGKSGAGQSYVVFGDHLAIVNNQLTITKGQTQTFSMNNLNATSTYINHNIALLQFQMNAIQQGYFQFVANPGVAITSFSQQNIFDAQVQFVHNGSDNSPSYNVTVNDGWAVTSSEAAAITFNYPPILGNHQLTLSQGETVLLSSNNFSATDVNNTAAEITFLISVVQNGQFEVVSNPGVVITSFTQAQVNANVIQFVQNGSPMAPSFNVALTDGITTIASVVGVIDFNIAPVLINNQLDISQGESKVLSSINLSATDSDSADADLQFSVTGIMQGYFDLVSNPGVPITTFYQQNITDNQIQFTQNDSPNPPAYNVSVSDGRVSTVASPSTITFNYKPVLITNTLTLNQGETKLLTPAELDSTDLDNTSAELTLIITNLQRGQFEIVSNPGVAITSFTQAQVNAANTIQFVQDGSANEPGYNVTVNDGLLASTSEAAMINFNYAPVFINNKLTINQGQSIVISSNDINATDPDSTDTNLLFIVSNLQYGQFEAIANPGVAIPNFTQQQVNANDLQFVQDGSNDAPMYSLSINDGIFTTAPPQPANITFSVVNAAPVIGNNQLTINQGETVLFSSAQLSATDADNSDAGLQLIFSNVENGRFELTSASGIAISQLLQQQIYSGHLQFVHDGSWNAPSYEVTVTDSSKNDGPEAAMIAFNSKPILEANNLSVRREDTAIITLKNLKAIDNQTPNAELIFLVSALKHGQFELIDKPGIRVNQFPQSDVDLINVQFVHDGSENQPNYNITVSDGILSSPSNKADIKWDPDIRNTASPRGSDSIARNILVGTFLSVGVVGTLLLCYMSMGFLQKRRLKAAGQRGNEEQAHFYQTVIIPIAQAVFKQIKVTGFMNYIGANQMEAYVAEIATVVNEINQLGIQVELQEMNPEHQTQLLNQIVKQMKRHLGIQSGICNRAWFTSFFKPQIKPEMIGQKAKRIASSVHAALMGNPEEDLDEIELSKMGLLAGDERRDSMNSNADDATQSQAVENARLQRLLEERENDIQQRDIENERLKALLNQQALDGSFNSTTSYVKLA